MSLPISLGRFAAVWTIMAVAMTANGIIRELLLKRMLEPGNANALSAILGIALIAVITSIGFRVIGDPSAMELLALSLALVVATVVFETVVGRVVDHKSWSELLEHYDLPHGELLPLVLLWLALTPFVWVRWARRG